MDWQTALLIASGIFGIFVIFRFRPVLSGKSVFAGGAKRSELRSLMKQVVGESDSEKKAELLCRAGELCLDAPGLNRRAYSYFFRAIVMAPASPTVFSQASKRLAAAPRLLEKACWRVLAECGSSEPAHPNFRDALKQLSMAYELRKDLRKAAAMRAILNLTNDHGSIHA